MLCTIQAYILNLGSVNLPGSLLVKTSLLLVILIHVCFKIFSTMSQNRHSPFGRTGHVAVSYKGRVYIWGGYNENIDNHVHSYINPQELSIYCTVTEKWQKKICSIVDGPTAMSGATASIIDDHLYLFGGYCHEPEGSSYHLYCLNLNTYSWEKLSPSGSYPFAVDKAVSWHHMGKLYIFGGFGTPTSLSAHNSGFEFVYEQQIWKGWTNQFYQYDPDKNRWSVPKFKGNLPLPRAAHAAAIIDEKVYIFGGRHNRCRVNDLHCIDMRTLRWSGPLRVKGPLPEGRSWHSLTALSGACILLYGGFSHSNRALNDSWLFNTETFTWTQINATDNKTRLWHTGSSTVEDEVMIFGGCSSNILHNELRAVQADEIIFLNISPKSLLRLCLDRVIQLRELASQWNMLPQSLQVLLDHRSRVNQCSSLDGS